MNFSFDNKTLNMKLYGICIKMNCVLNEALALKVYKNFHIIVGPGLPRYICPNYTFLHWIFLTFVLAPPLQLILIQKPGHFKCFQKFNTICAIILCYYYFGCTQCPMCLDLISEDDYTAEALEPSVNALFNNNNNNNSRFLKTHKTVVSMLFTIR